MSDIVERLQATAKRQSVLIRRWEWLAVWLIVWPHADIEACFLSGSRQKHLCRDDYILTYTRVSGIKMEVCAKYVYTGKLP